MNRVQSALPWRMRQGCTGLPPPLTPLLHRVAANFVFRKILAKIILNFANFKENFANHEIKNFAKIS